MDQRTLFKVEQMAPSGAEALEKLRARVEVCAKCEISASRKRIVFGTGNPDHPKVMFIGEAPGGQDETTGIPYTGSSGFILRKMIAKMKLTEEDYYLCTLLCCRLPANPVRFPTQQEAANCWEHLEGRLQIVQPSVIVTFGSTVSRLLLKTDKGVSSLRGKTAWWRETPVVVSFHLSYLERKPEEKVEAWNDMQLVLDLLKEMKK